MSAQPSIEEAFESAKTDFLKSLKDPETYDFSKFTSINDVYDATEEIQEQQRKTGTLRDLNRIRPYLECLSQYVDVIEIFIQAKPDVLCLIWGPIKLLLQISSTLIKSFDKVIEVLAEVGHCLPHFQKYTELFGTNHHIKAVLCLFYRDMLDFHATVLNFFRKNKWKVFFESLWPRSANKISAIQNNIIRHKALMNSEVTLENVVQAYEARERAYREYERTHQFQDRQNFEDVKLALIPHLYDGDLEKFGRECQIGSGQWLQEEDRFKIWADAKDHSVRLFWLQGIPGAGKTVMSSIIIHRMRNAGQNVLFAFLMHKNEAHNCALKILHSLIFQVLIDNQALRPVMHEAYISNYRQITSSLDFTIELFSDLIKDSGPTFIIIDGMDEIPEIERRLLLKALIGLFQTHKDVKLLVSSRGERDISSLLGNDVPSVRVDHRNKEDIDIYIQKEIDIWLPELQSLGADDQMCSEVKALSRSIVEKAKGMFLYAKLVLNNVMAQDNLDDIEDEINNLPDGLEQAYGRVLSRIDKGLNPKERLAARKILEWMGCAAYSLRKEELLQALAIEPGETSFSKGRRVFRDILKLCGPIIETENDIVQFVHFTAKEYLFGKQSNEFLRSNEAHLGIASVCLSYLSFDCFGEEAFSNDLRDNILSGDYVLLVYAATEWLEHIRSCAQHLQAESVQSLACIISTFFEFRENYLFEASKKSHHAAKTHFLPFKELPNVYDSLIEMDVFMKRKKTGLLEENDESWVDQDPSTISATIIQIWKQLEEMLCPSEDHLPSCQCAKLRALYGGGLFRCDRITCEYYRTGFDTRSARDGHLIIHNRPYKCPEQDCQFAEIGFRSEVSLSRHASKSHQTHSQFQGNVPNRPPADGFHPKDLELIIKDAVRANEVDYVRILLARTDENLPRYLLNIAAAEASPDMLELLLEEVSNAPLWKLLFEAIGSQNLATVNYLITRGVDVARDEELMKKALETCNPEVIDILLNHGAQLVEHDGMLTESLITWRRMTLKEEDEEKLLKRLYQVRKYVIGVSAYGKALLYASASLTSIPLIEYFLENGADIDYKNQSGSIALHEVIKAGSNRHAQIAKFLLQRGANPYPSKPKSGANISKLAGMRRVEEYFRMSWDELVKEVQSERALNAD